MHAGCVQIADGASSQSAACVCWMIHSCSSGASPVSQFTSGLFLSPQKRKRREKDDSDAVSLSSFDFKVNAAFTSQESQKGEVKSASGIKVVHLTISS